MKTIMIGAGAGCLDVLQLWEQGRLAIFDLEVLAVVDTNPDAPGMRYARERGWKTMESVVDAMGLPGLELVIELTGSEDLLDDIYFLLPPGVRLMDHVVARVFWDLDNVALNLHHELEKKSALEARIEEDRERLQEILDTLPDVVMVLDPEMRIERVNRRFEKVTGLPHGKARGTHCYESFCLENPNTNPGDHGCPFQQVMETKQPVELVHYRVRPDNGKGVYFQITANPIFGDDGEIIRIVETSREITEQVLLKRETEQTARRFSQILETVHAAITIKNLDGRFELANPKALRLLDMSEEQVLGKRASDLFGAEAADLIEELDSYVLEDGQPHVSEEAYTFGGGEHTLISERFPILDYRGKMVGICCVSRDVTRERQLRRELMHNERLAAVGKLAAGVAHELNNPLTGILTFAEDLMLEADDKDPVREDYEIIVRETMRCRRIVRDLLDFSRQQAPQRRPTDLDTVVRRTVAMVERQASFHDVDIQVNTEDRLPHVAVDPRQIQQALLNLVINARDAMDAKGQLTIRNSLRKDGRAVLLSVTDTGCGIPQEQHSKVLEPFFSTKGERGNGLGLPAVVSAMEQHDGQVTFESEEGVGTTFHLVFPNTLQDGKSA